VILFLFAAVAGGVRLGGSTWATLAVRLLLGCVPFIGLGFAIGYGVSANAAPAVANLVYLPLSFASGLFLPVSQLPDAVQRLAPLLPTYHYGQLAWSAVGAGSESLGRSAAWLAGWSVLLFALALRAYRRDQARKFS
jgi:ABC-2 type transport system permease protein